MTDVQSALQEAIRAEADATITPAWQTLRQRRRRRRLVRGVTGSMLFGAALVVGASAVGNSQRSDELTTADSPPQTREADFPARATADVSSLLGSGWTLAYPPHTSVATTSGDASAPPPAKFGPCSSFTSLTFRPTATAPPVTDGQPPRPLPGIDVWLTECSHPSQLGLTDAAAVAAESADGTPDQLVAATDEAIGPSAHMWVYASSHPADDARLVGALWTDTGLLVSVRQHGEPAVEGRLFPANAASLLSELARRWT